MEPEVATPPTPDERTLAMLAHVLQMFSGFIGPLIIYLVKRRDSRFVAFHAVQALIWQVVLFALAVLSVMAWVVAMLGAMTALSMVASFVVLFSIALKHLHQSNQLPPGFFPAFPLIALVWAAGWVVGIALAVVYGIRASQGEWAGYPLIGRWARRLARV
jgi:uncharacterized protein